MKKILIMSSLIVILLILVIGCAEEITVEETSIEKEITKSIEEQKTAEQVIEKIITEEKKKEEKPIIKTEEKQVEEEPAEKTEEKVEAEEKAVLEEKPVEAKTETVEKAELPKTYSGKVTQLNPPRGDLYTGELTTTDLRHYKFEARIPITRGDVVIFTLDNNQIAIVVKKETVTQASKQTISLDDAQPEGTVLGRIRKVVSLRDGGVEGVVINAASGKEYRYQTTMDLVVGDDVYYKPGTGLVEIVKIIEVKRAK